jgi:hypothetical protein
LNLFGWRETQRLWNILSGASYKILGTCDIGRPIVLYMREIIAVFICFSFHIWCITADFSLVCDVVFFVDMDIFMRLPEEI